MFNTKHVNQTSAMHRISLIRASQLMPARMRSRISAYGQQHIEVYNLGKSSCAGALDMNASTGNNGVCEVVLQFILF
jgi:hypothetical protein